MTQENSEYTQSEWKESNFGIKDQKSLVHIFDVMRNKLYTDKHLAVLREYSNNATDAHIDSDQRNRPIEITLPTEKDPYLKIRDYGKGLCQDDVRNIYVMYGTSTKRGSDKYNGQLGFGSKAFFSYTDTFQIISWNEGKKTTYEAYLDHTMLGALTLIKEEPSEESSGIEVSGKVDLTDISTFQEKAQHLYKYFEVKPDIKNLEKEIPELEIVLQKDNWKLFKKTNRYTSEKFILMGNVAYPINTNVLSSMLKKTEDIELIRTFNNLNTGFLVEVPIGTVSIAASREALEYNKDTAKAIIRALRNFHGSLQNCIIEKVQTADDIVEAKRTLIENDGIIQNFLLKILPIKYKEELIENTYFTFPELTRELDYGGKKLNETLYNIDFFYRQSYYSNEKIFKKYPQQKSNFILSDGTLLVFRDIKNKTRLRIDKCFYDNQNIKSIYLINYESSFSTEVKNKFTETIPEKYFKNISSLEPLVSEKVNKQSEYNSKYSKRFFSLAENTEGDGSIDDWNVIKPEKDKEYICMFLDSFSPRIEADSSFNVNIGFLKSILTYLNIPEDKLLLLKKQNKVWPAIKENWKTLQSLIETKVYPRIDEIRLSRIPNKIKDLATFDESILSLMQNTSSLWIKDEFKEQFVLFSERQEILTHIEEVIFLKDILAYQKNKLELKKQLIDICYPINEESIVGEINTKIYTRYPMLRYIQSRDFSNPSIEEYINMIDKVKENE